MNLRSLYGRTAAYVAIVVFIIAKIPHFFYAFFWDESWVYAPAIKLMYAHGPSLLPDAIPVDYTRGHPLLYHAACASWMRVFGNSNAAMHSFALFISVWLAVSVYECVRSLFSPRSGFICLVILLLGLPFFASATFVLTDIPLALFAFLSLYAYCKEKYMSATVMLAILFLMKESGLVMVMIVGIDVMVDLFSKRRSLNRIVAKGCVLVFSLVPLAAFFIAQKRSLGWYVNPGHVSIMHFGISDTLGYLRRSLRFLFFTNKSFLPALLLVAVLAWSAIAERKLKFLLPVIAIVAVYLLIDVFGAGDVVFYIFAASLVVSVIVFLWRPLPSFAPLQQRFIKLSVGFTAVFIYFCCVNFFEERYLMPALLFSVVLLGICVDSILSYSLGPVGKGSILAVFTAAGIINLAAGKDDLDVYDRIKVQQDMVDFLEQHRYYGKHIYTGSFLAQVHLKDPNTGFRSTSPAFTHVSDTLGEKTELAVFDNVEFDGQYEKVRSDSNFVLLHSYRVNEVWVSIYERRPIRGHGLSALAH